MEGMIRIIPRGAVTGRGRNGAAGSFGCHTSGARCAPEGGIDSPALRAHPCGAHCVRPAPLRGLSNGGFESSHPSPPDTKKPAFAGCFVSGGEGGIRTLDTLLTYTHFPGVLLKPLGHLTGTFADRWRLATCRGRVDYPSRGVIATRCGALVRHGFRGCQIAGEIMGGEAGGNLAPGAEQLGSQRQTGASTAFQAASEAGQLFLRSMDLQDRVVL